MTHPGNASQAMLNLPYGIVQKGDHIATQAI